MMHSDVFISYSTKDKPTADATCAVLEAAGIRCWIAPRDIRPGGEYGAAIIEAIDRARVTVLIFSSNANESRQIHREIERAVSKGVPIVPVRIEEVAPTKSMEYFLGSIHWLDALTPPIEKHLGQLVDTVKALLPTDGQPRDPNRDVGLENTVRSMPTVRATETMGTARSGRAVPPRNPQRWSIPIIGGLAFIALLAGTVWFLQGRSGTPVSDPAIDTVQREAEALVPEVVPFIPDGDRDAIRADYMTAPDYKAIAISSSRGAFITGQKDEATAKEAAMTACQRTTNNARSCMLYAVGDTVVFTGGRPPLPPQPWVIRDTGIERPLAAKDIPLIRDLDREFFDQTYAGMPKPKAIAIARGQYIIYSRQASTDEAIRRSLERCGFVAGTTCMIVAVDDTFVVPIPTTMKPIGLFRPTSTLAIAPESREDLERRLGVATGGWRAVAVGPSGRPGLSLRARSEQEAVNGALADCARQDHSCRIVAIGPFVVEPLPTVSAAAPTQPPPAPASPERAADKLVPERIPYITSKERSLIRTAYLPAAGHKAIAIGSRSAYVVGQKDEETARTAALAACRNIRNATGFECEIYAIGDSVVYARAAPPMPPEPWLVRNKAFERPFIATDVPLISEASRAWLEKAHSAARGSKALAVGHQGRYAFVGLEASPEDAARRALEICGRAGGACMIVAVDEVFIVPIPTMMKVNGLFRSGSLASLKEEARNEVERRLGATAREWSAVAIGDAGRPGVIVGAPSEKAAIDSALADCGRKDRLCRVIAIGPFSVEPLAR